MATCSKKLWIHRARSLKSGALDVDDFVVIVLISDQLSGDETLSVMELWGAEFQENDALLLKSAFILMLSTLLIFALVRCRAKDEDLFKSLCHVCTSLWALN